MNKGKERSLLKKEAAAERDRFLSGDDFGLKKSVNCRIEADGVGGGKLSKQSSLPVPRPGFILPRQHV